MRPPKVDELDYIQFLIAAQRVYTCTEAARCQPEDAKAPAHDAFTRLLSRQPPDTAALWREVEPLVQKDVGILVLDDTTLDKPHGRKIELVTRHWSGKHRRVVWGINLITLLWSDGSRALPCDCRIYDKPLEGGKTKNEHFQEMLQSAKERGFAPSMVCFDGWYSSLENLKAVRSYDWHFLTRLKHNRQVNPDGSGNVAVDTLEIAAEGVRVHLKGFGFIRVFRTVAPDGDAEFWATSRLEMSESERAELERQCFAIENYVVSSSAAGWSGRRCARPTRSAVTSCYQCVPLCGWKPTEHAPGEVGTRPKRTLCGKLSAPTWHNPRFNSRQSRNSYGYNLFGHGRLREEIGVRNLTLPKPARPAQGSNLD